MIKLLKNKRKNSDKAAANSVSFIFIMTFIMILMVSFIDMSMYFHTKNQLQDAAQAGARTTAMYGGANTSLVTKYGKGTTPQSVVYDAIPRKLRDDGVVINPIRKGDISCTSRANVGRPVWCQINYTYKGVFSAGKATKFGNQAGMTNASIFGNKNDNKSSAKGAKKVIAYSVSEVTAK